MLICMLLSFKDLDLMHLKMRLKLQSRLFFYFFNNAWIGGIEIKDTDLFISALITNGVSIYQHML